MKYNKKELAYSIFILIPNDCFQTQFEICVCIKIIIIRRYTYAKYQLLLSASLSKIRFLHNNNNTNLSTALNGRLHRQVDRHVCARCSLMYSSQHLDSFIYSFTI